jgi:5-methylcytosine-specific restriction protein A
MPEPPRRPCAGGCGTLVERGRCAACAPKSGEHLRLSSTERGYGTKWQKFSKSYLAAHPLCVDPFHVHGEVLVPATETDHIIPHKGDMALFWAIDTNVQGLCKPCHSTKTASEGGFGHGMSW